ncbi:MAG: hypothetical protein Q4B29_01420 [Candidatus Saccharibacteria bacterium]|nr:hypothetical protein [Candidatus Saccharibacteria bacterium]
MKSILYVCEKFRNGGLEEKILSEVVNNKKHNIKSFLISNDILEKHTKTFEKTLKIDSSPINKEHINTKNILKNRDAICSFCKKHNIEFIECHPNFISIPTILAAEKLNLPITFTLHGIVSCHFSYQHNTKTYLFVYILLKYGFDQYFAVAEYLQEIFSFLSSNMLISRNGFYPNTQLYERPQNQNKIAIASRLDSDKSQIIIDFLQFLQGVRPPLVIDIYGNGDNINNVDDYIKNKNIHHQITLKGWQQNLAEHLTKNRYNAVFGMGRAALDAIKSKTPCGILGYGGFIDFLVPDNFDTFLKINLTSWDSFPKDKSFEKLLKDVFYNPEKYIIQDCQLKLLDNDILWAKHFEEINNINFKNKPIISKINSILENNDEDVFNSLVPSQIATIINDEHKYDIPYFIINTYLSEKMAYEEKLDDQKNEIKAITSSTFWKTTKPLRSLLGKFHN